MPLLLQFVFCNTQVRGAVKLSIVFVNKSIIIPQLKWFIKTVRHSSKTFEMLRVAHLAMPCAHITNPALFAFYFYPFLEGITCFLDDCCMPGSSLDFKTLRLSEFILPLEVKDNFEIVLEEGINFGNITVARARL